MPLTYTVTQLPDMAWAVTDANGKTWCVCDREGDAERIAGVMNSEGELISAVKETLEIGSLISSNAHKAVLVEFIRATQAARAAIANAESRT